MAYLAETDEWPEGIYQLEEDDPVQGGPSGVDNLQAKQLASRTRFLRLLLEGFVAGKASTSEAQAGLDDTKWMTPLKVAQVIAQLVNSSPAALNTLSELASALGNDPSFATTMTNALAGKVATTNKATTAEAQTGTDDTKWMTPLKVAQAISALAATVLSATEAVAGKVQLATAAETITGTSTTKAVHPAGAAAMVNNRIAALVNSSPALLDTLSEIAAALGNDPSFATTMTNALAGKVATTNKATTAEAQTGTDDTKWMTPLKVAQAISALAATILSATETVAGKVQLATSAETIIGTSTTKAVHPAGVKAAIDSAFAGSGLAYSLAPNGYIKLPSWMGGILIQWGTATASHTGPQAVNFPVAFPSICVSLMLTPTQSVNGVNSEYESISASGFVFSNFALDTRVRLSVSSKWFAIGY